MKLPNPHLAVVDVRKLQEYCLSTVHPRGRHKARVFLAVLGIEKRDWKLLYDGLMKAAAHQEAVPGELDEFGQRYILDWRMRGPAGEGLVRSLWMVRTNENFARMISCFVL